MSVLLTAGLMMNGFNIPAYAEISGATDDDSVFGDLIRQEEKATDSNAVMKIASDVPENIQTIIDALGGDSCAEYADGVIRLKDSIDIGETVYVNDGESYEIDLNGFEIRCNSQLNIFYVSDGSLTISGNGRIVENADKDAICITGSNSVVTLKSGTIEKTVSGKGRCVAFMNDATFNMEDGEIVNMTDGGIGVGVLANGNFNMSGGKITTDDFAVTGNGTAHGTTINITGGEIISENACGIYHPQNGVMNISNATISGPAGIVARAGQITIDGRDTVIESTAPGTVRIGDVGYDVPDSAIDADKNLDYVYDSLHIVILGGTFKSTEENPAVVLTDSNGEIPDSAHEKFDVKGGHFVNPGANFKNYVDDDCTAAKKGKDSNETVVGPDLQSVVDDLDPASGDTIVIEKTPAGSSADGVENGVIVDNESGNDVTINEEIITDEEETEIGPNLDVLESLKEKVDGINEKDYDTSDPYYQAFAAAKKKFDDLYSRKDTLSKSDQGEIDRVAEEMRKALENIEKARKHDPGSDYTEDTEEITDATNEADNYGANSALKGDWTYDAARDKWTFENYHYKNQWAYIYNPYAVNGQSREAWFYFDEHGEMLTGWYMDEHGNCYYLHDISDGERGAMETGWTWIQGKCFYFSEVRDGTEGHMLRNTVTPDGYTVDENGAWTVNGVVMTR